MDERCEHCLASEWTEPVYSEREVLQVGCWKCYHIYSQLDTGYIIGRCDSKNPIFWKDLKRQWDKVMDRKK